ncbi:MAG TPA: hypothetical protein VFU47_02895, partial [Armatimonadota bacterium]|nr:hypothetical protein [Armatimonadota bacterium]
MVASARRPTPAVQAREFAPGFAGSAACAECHSSLAQRQAETHHAHTLRDAPAVEALTPLPAPAWMPDPELALSYRITRRDENLGVEAQGRSETQWQPLQWA